MTNSPSCSVAAIPAGKSGARSRFPAILSRLVWLFGSKRTFVSALLVLASLSLLALALQIPRGLGCSDEAWYLVLARDGMAGNGSVWTRIFGFVPDSVTAWRTLSAAVRIVSGPLFCLALLRLSGVKPSGTRRIALSAAAVLAADPSPVFAASYYNLNGLLFAVALCLSTVPAESGWRGPASAFAAGMALFFLLPVFPTNFPPCLAAILAVMYLPGFRSTPRFIAFAAGLAAGAALFFSCFMTVSEYAGMIRSVAGGAGGAGTHGLKNIAFWIEKSGIHLCFRIVLPAAAMFLSMSVFRSRVPAGLAVPAAAAALAAGSLFAAAMPFYDFINGFESRLPADFPWIAAVFLALASSRSRSVGDMAFLVAVAAIPVVLSFGTAVPLGSRARIYVWPLAFAAFAKAESSAAGRKAAVLRASFLLLVAVSALFAFRQHTGSWILLERNFFLPRTRDAETGLLLSRPFSDNVAKCREAGLGGAVVQPLSRNDWRYVFALGATPVSYDFECESFAPAKAPAMAENGGACFIVAPARSGTGFPRAGGGSSPSEAVPVLSFSDIDGSRRVYRIEKK